MFKGYRFNKKNKIMKNIGKNLFNMIYAQADGYRNGIWNVESEIMDLAITIRSVNRKSFNADELMEALDNTRKALIRFKIRYPHIIRNEWDTISYDQIMEKLKKIEDMIEELDHIN